MGIINEYEEILIGNRKKISSNYFLFDKKGNERVALSVIRYAIENLLGWDVHNAIKLFNSNYISFMKLDQMVKYIVFPSDVTKDDTEYILYLLYPKYVDYDIKRYTLRIYEKVMNNQNLLFKSADDLYNFFASKDCIKYLKQNKLYQLYVSFYSTPLEYMHDSMPSSVKNEFLFHNYMFLNKYQQVVTEEEKAEKNKAR